MQQRNVRLIEDKDELSMFVVGVSGCPNVDLRNNELRHSLVRVALALCGYTRGER